MKTLTILAMMSPLLAAAPAMAQMQEYNPNNQYLARIDQKVADCYASAAWMALNLPRFRAQIEHRQIGPTDFDRDTMIRNIVAQPGCRSMATTLYRQSVQMVGVSGMTDDEAARRERNVAEIALDAVVAGYNPIRPGN